MVAKKILIGLAFLLPWPLLAQEVLLPLQTGPVAQRIATKDASQPLPLPFFDDFSSPNTATFSLSGGATTGTGAGLRPPTVGVATLDAIGADGRLYDNASSALFPADTLCSNKIALGSMTVADSVVLSFYYLPGGGKGELWKRIGDAPETNDSLMLDFYRASDSTWVTVWSRGGTDVDSLIALTGREWQYVAVTLGDTAFFNDAFAFRFRNYCSLTPTTKAGMSGNCDYWHLDYFLLDRGRTSIGEPDFRDVAFVEPAPSMMSLYQAMPARQYRRSDMKDSLSVTITNLFSSSLATKYRYAVVDASGDTLYRYDGGYENAPSYLPEGTYQQAAAHASPEVGYSFAESEVPTEYTVVHMVREGVGGDDYPSNDTVRFHQVFDNYYAYDDGTAENGYGLTSTASRIFLAYRFDLNMEDTLTALDLYFNRTLDGENESIPFTIMVWADDGGKPGRVLYRDASNRHPLFAGLDKYSRYLLEYPVLVEGSIYVGFEQGSNYFINLGFDRSHDVCDRIYYHTSAVWQQSILSGALMMRPCFGVAATVGIQQVSPEASHFSLSPNPASEWVRVEGVPEGTLVEVFDMWGRKLLSSSHNLFSTGNIPNGIYLVRCGTHIQKLIIRH